MATIETVLGSSQEIDENSIGYLLNEKAARKVPVITVDFLLDAEGRYVAAEIPENLIQLITDAVAETEKGLVNLYIEEAEVWNSKQKKILEEYKLEQEISEKATRKNPVELIFDALEKEGKPVSALRIDYKRGGLSGPKTGSFLKYLSQVGIKDELVHEDVKAMLKRSKLTDENRTWDILANELGIKAPLPEKPAPEVEFKELAPLINELESVVTAAYKRLPLEGVAVSSGVWAELGIDLSAVYRKVAESFLYLNNSYFLVKATGIGEAAGSIRVVELDGSRGSLKAGTPKQLRGNLRLPTEIVDDFYKLCAVLERAYAGSIDENGEKLVISTIILERILKGKTEIAISVYPGVSNRRVEECRERYGSTAEAIATGIENDEGDYAHFKLHNGAVISAHEVQDVMNYLADLVPENLYMLREANSLMRKYEKEKKEVDKFESTGKRWTGPYRQSDITEVLNISKKVYEELSDALMCLAEGAGRWPSSTSHELDFKVIEFYGLNHAEAAAKI